jgi:hypothetical protein
LNGLCSIIGAFPGHGRCFANDAAGRAAHQPHVAAARTHHKAIWEQAAALIKLNVNPDKLSHEALAAELTNHLVPGAVLIPGAVGTMPELQQAGFHYAK